MDMCLLVLLPLYKDPNSEHHLFLYVKAVVVANMYPLALSSEEAFAGLHAPFPRKRGGFSRFVRLGLSPRDCPLRLPTTEAHFRRA